MCGNLPVCMYALHGSMYKWRYAHYGEKQTKIKWQILSWAVYFLLIGLFAHRLFFLQAWPWGWFSVPVVLELVTHQNSKTNSPAVIRCHRHQRRRFQAICLSTNTLMVHMYVRWRAYCKEKIHVLWGVGKWEKNGLGSPTHVSKTW